MGWGRVGYYISEHRERIGYGREGVRVGEGGVERGSTYDQSTGKG